MASNVTWHDHNAGLDHCSVTRHDHNKAGRRITTMLTCPECFEPFVSGVNARAIYCSAACRQQAYRRRIDPLSCTPERKRERAQRAARTRARATRAFICETCRDEFRCVLAQGNRRFCSNACRQAAYRKRKAQA